MPVDIITKL